ncbi:MAG TPA: hypothetical protein VM934_05965 [Pyrinomonadaceae bacterium]|jgi:hypothetical protein|nr:hypothetical protein [Pyrinomonadaceae bacterium]
MRLRYVALTFSLVMLFEISAATRALASEVAAHADLFGGPAPSFELGTNEPETPAPPAPVPTPLEFEASMVADKESYTDVFSILREDNSCSRFFGGAARAAGVFNQLVPRMRKKSLGDKETGIRMSGSYTHYEDNITGASYRLFDEVAVNTDGPFFRKIPTQRVGAMNVGRFPAWTRQARALLLLHELAHLVRGESGGWLIPNDGGNASLSAQNTRAVEKACLGQLLALEERHAE